LIPFDLEGISFQGVFSSRYRRLCLGQEKNVECGQLRPIAHRGVEEIVQPGVVAAMLSKFAIRSKPSQMAESLLSVQT
jgi:hypothetical protein